MVTSELESIKYLTSFLGNINEIFAYFSLRSKTKILDKIFGIAIMLNDKQPSVIDTLFRKMQNTEKPKINKKDCKNHHEAVIG